MKAKPCSCDPPRYRPGKPYARGTDCPMCWQWHNNPVYRGEQPHGNEVVVMECRFGLEVVRVPSVRDYRRCQKGHGTLIAQAPEVGKVVCGCWTFPAGCASCPDFEKVED